MYYRFAVKNLTQPFISDLDSDFMDSDELCEAR